MARTKSDVPLFRHHKPSGRAYAVLADGRRLYFGKHSDPESRRRFDRWLAEWLCNGRRTNADPNRLTVAELVAAFMRHAATY